VMPQPVDLVECADNTIWVSWLNGAVASVAPSGAGLDTTAAVTLYPLPTTGGKPLCLVTAGDGAL
jgi:hypothetical protein